MRRARLCLVVLLAVGLTGCLFRRDAITPSWLKPFGGPSGPDVVVMDIALLEVPVGDRFVNSELWSTTDDQILGPEERKRLEENGLRVGKVSGRPPDGLNDLLTSDRTNRQPRRVSKRATDSHALAIGGQRDVCTFQLVLDGQTEERRFEQAGCQLQITPVLTKDGKVQLQFLPQIQHADRKRSTLTPAIALALQSQRPSETFSALRWELPIGLNEFIVVGTRFDKRESLGFQFFVTSTGDQPAQHLLAIRAGRMGQPTESPAPVTVTPGRTVPLAGQASAPLAIP